MEQMKVTMMIRVLLATLLLSAAMHVTAIASSLTVSQVSREPAVISLGAKDGVIIAYRLSKAAKTMIKIFDSRDLLIRHIASNALQSAGSHQMVWDGKDESGQLVPPNYYTFIVEAQAEDGEMVVHDLTDLTGGQSLTVQHAASFDPEQGLINYVLPAPALVNIRIGLSNGGPLLGTIVDWVARPGGRNHEPWNGWDAGKVIEISKMKEYQIGVSAYALPHNSIIVQAADKPNRPGFIKNVDWPSESRAKNSRRKQMYNHWQHSRDKCYDPAIRLSLPPQIKRRADGLAVIQEPVTLSMSVAEKDQSFMYDQRFEVVYYVDFVFVYEEELGYTPFNWQWNPQGVNEGVHYLTTMLRGYEGHFGTTTVKVFVETPSVQKSSAEK